MIRYFSSLDDTDDGANVLERLLILLGTLGVLLALYLTYVLNANHLEGGEFSFRQYIKDKDGGVKQLQIP